MSIHEKYENIAGLDLWPAAVAGMAPSSKACCFRASYVDSEALCRDLPGAILSRREFEVWSKLRFPERRCRQWLLGRLCVKRAVGVSIVRQNGPELVPSAIEIFTDQHGRPFVCEALSERLNLRLSISISHSEGVVAAIAAKCDTFRKVGIDVEPVERDCRLLERVAFGHSEQSLLSKLPTGVRQEWVIRLWCAKEALAKAVGRGMVGGPLGFVTEKLEAATGDVTVRVAGRLAHQLDGLKDRSFPVCTGSENGFIYATSVLN
jgi:phosphopantetheinyl transferase